MYSCRSLARGVSVTVNDLLIQLSEVAKHGRANDTVAVAVTRSSAAIGPAHVVDITGTTIGFDWDSGRIILHGAEPVFAGLENLKSAARFADKVREALWWRRDCGANDRNKNANCLSCIEEALDEWLPDRCEKHDED